MKAEGKRERAAAAAAYRVGHEGAVGVVDNWRESAVIIEEHHDALPFRRRDDVVEVYQSGRVLPLRRDHRH